MIKIAFLEEKQLNQIKLILDKYEKYYLEKKSQDLFFEATCRDALKEITDYDSACMFLELVERKIDKQNRQKRIELNKADLSDIEYEQAQLDFARHWAKIFAPEVKNERNMAGEIIDYQKAYKVLKQNEVEEGAYPWDELSKALRCDTATAKSIYYTYREGTNIDKFIFDRVKFILIANKCNSLKELASAMPAQSEYDKKIMARDFLRFKVKEAMANIAKIGTRNYDIEK